MITQLRLDNFKSWESTGLLRLKPITLLFGANSSGKSSIIQFLMLLKQTIESRDKSEILKFGGSPSDYVDLGSFEECITNHDSDKSLGFLLVFARKVISDNERTASIAADIRMYRGGIGVRILNLRTRENVRYRWTRSGGLTSRKSGLRTRERQVDGFGLLGLYGLYRKSFSQRSGVHDKALWFAAQEIDFLFRRVFYVGPIRDNPKRLYTWSGRRSQSVGLRGEYAIDAVLGDMIAKQAESSSAMDDLLIGLDGTPLLGRLTYWLKKFGLADEVLIQPLGEKSKYYEVALLTSTKATPSLLPEVGFGVSQIIPIIVQAYAAPTASIILLEQPEIHLHPAVQSALGDFLIEVSKERGIQFIVETHSEHLLRRLQLHIATEDIDSNYVSTYFCSFDKPSGVSKIERLKLNNLGEISNWPKDFFGDVTGELKQIAVARIKQTSSDEE